MIQIWLKKAENGQKQAKMQSKVANSPNYAKKGQKRAKIHPKVANTENEAEGRVHQPAPHQAIFNPPSTVSIVVPPYPFQPTGQPLQDQSVAYTPKAASNPYPP